ncbi:MAG: macB 4 [Firmicutes bacterium]|nr:macB 4 [Bacillota bacterium]
MTISLNGVSKVYKAGESKVQALDDVTFSIKRGEFVAITGSSGSGKSTLMNILACFEQPTSGSYTIDGQKIEVLGNKNSAAKLKRKIGFVSQNFYFLPRMSVLQNVSLPLLFEGNDKLERYERAAWALKTVGLAHCMKHRPSILTEAQRQQAAIARTIIHDPDIILVDGQQAIFSRN